MTTTTEMIDVVVVEDHPMFREALTRAIRARDDMKVVAATGSGREAMKAVRDLSPQVCVLDLGLPDIDGVEVLKCVVSEELDTRVLVLSGDGDSEVVYALIEAGASGFERKTAGPGELVEAIVAVAGGETVLPKELLGGLAEQIRAHRSPPGPMLSDRELEILREVAEGFTAAEIATKLHLAESTVKTHLTRIYDKLGVSERAAAVAQAMRHGLID
ncbi:MAG: response regulator transcription factor [Solirubrobacterales bacterium]|nr:response regulator transcription factor [Solirubrobacterales bacterium]